MPCKVRASAFGEEVSRQPGQLDLPRQTGCFTKRDPLSLLFLPVPSGFEPQLAHVLSSVDVSGEARMFSDVGGGGDHFSNFNVSCHYFHSGRIIIKYNLPWKSLLIASMWPKPDIWAGWPAHPYVTSDFLINSFNLNFFFLSSKLLKLFTPRLLGTDVGSQAVLPHGSGKTRAPPGILKHIMRLFSCIVTFHLSMNSGLIKQLWFWYKNLKFFYALRITQIIKALDNRSLTFLWLFLLLL